MANGRAAGVRTGFVARPTAATGRGRIQANKVRPTNRRNQRTDCQELMALLKVSEHDVDESRREPSSNVVIGRGIKSED